MICSSVSIGACSTRPREGGRAGAIGSIGAEGAELRRWICLRRARLRLSLLGRATQSRLSRHRLARISGISPDQIGTSPLSSLMMGLIPYLSLFHMHFFFKFIGIFLNHFL